MGEFMELEFARYWPKIKIGEILLFYTPEILHVHASASWFKIILIYVVDVFTVLMVMRMRIENEACVGVRDLSHFSHQFLVFLSSSSDWFICLFSEFAGCPLILAPTIVISDWSDDQYILSIRDYCSYFRVTGIISTVAKKAAFRKAICIASCWCTVPEAKSWKGKIVVFTKTG